MATHDTKKMTVGRSFGEMDRADQSKYSAEYLRNHMSTGGGEPIPKGEKMTTERRVMQPRDPDTGQFGWNADAGLMRKYLRGWKRGKGVPLSVRRLNFNGNALEEGDIINIGGRTFKANRRISRQELIDHLKTIAAGGEEANSFRGTAERDMAKKYSYGKPTMSEWRFAKIVDVVGRGMEYSYLNDILSKKRGRISKFENASMSSTPAIFNISEAKRATAQA